MHKHDTNRTREETAHMRTIGELVKYYASRGLSEPSRRAVQRWCELFAHKAHSRRAKLLIDPKDQGNVLFYGSWKDCVQYIQREWEEHNYNE